MRGWLRFQPYYFLLTVLLFITEVCIAKFIHDDFIRPYVGDTLVVILIYCFLQSFFKLPVIPTAIGVLIFSFIIEWSQYMNLVERLGLKENKLANTIMGNSFAWEDILAYIAGITIIILVEKFKATRHVL